ncbi:peptidase S16 [Cavenderia fasciculata]|uniref:Lon protease homolog n=1 Tax=Cavenderia fasciculata TaxID=261658 RepID=F4PGJ4_CACFS|nr:peptidase S16 [Cavenderia fasciculata]EGG24828.1 peptidase S16 [Cavenderia fasciculata]|eukprot:XP_004362679.1 peptidase S16 [Cavenderia fasciculata]
MISLKLFRSATILRQSTTATATAGSLGSYVSGRSFLSSTTITTTTTTSQLNNNNNNYRLITSPSTSILSSFTINNNNSNGIQQRYMSTKKKDDKGEEVVVNDKDKEKKKKKKTTETSSTTTTTPKVAKKVSPLLKQSKLPLNAAIPKKRGRPSAASVAAATSSSSSSSSSSTTTEKEKEKKKKTVKPYITNPKDRKFLESMGLPTGAPKRKKRNSLGDVQVNVLAYPIFEKVVYPGSFAYFPINDKDYKALGSPVQLALFMVTPEIREQYGGKNRSEFHLTSLDQINHTGVLCEIKGQGKYIEGIQRVEIDDKISERRLREDREKEEANLRQLAKEFKITVTQPPTQRPLRVVATKIPDDPVKDRDQVKLRALSLQLAKRIQMLSLKFPESSFTQQFQTLSENYRIRILEEPGKMSDFVASLCRDSPIDYQKIIECTDILERLESVLPLVQTQFQLNEFNSKIEKHIDEKTAKQQKKFFLTEQMKMIKQELGIEQDEKVTLSKKFNERWEKLNVKDEQVKQVFKEEMDRLSSLEPSSSEYNVTRNYLEWITSLPWNVTTNDNFDIPSIKASLDRDHYGLDDIKEMIKTFIAVGKLRGSVGGKIILLVGPPGTGKTSIGKSIATALDRQFYRFSVGGISDVAEIKGHRRTFVGAMPGKIIQALKTVKTSNPVILIDEIDKISKGSHSDPFAALLEVLDPQQNKNFLDHYMDIPYDLSKVLFICTANLTHPIPAPLLDRMDVMRLNGYIQAEQIEIANNYIVPSVKSETGIGDDKLMITKEAIKHLCEYWCRESGVRNLKKMIERMFRKVAFKLASNPESNELITITPENLEEFAGLPKYRVKKYYQTPVPGIALGLGWSENGGVPLYVESVVDLYQPSAGLRATGSLGDVMKESIEIGYTYVKRYLELNVDPKNKFFEKNAIHIHAPEGATPKDGPSAGITMITSLLSLATGKPIQPNLAMTGEITLTGKVIPVGGITEKLIAAKREGVKKVVLPKDNRKELEDIPEFVKEGLQIYLANYYSEVADVAFNETPTLQPVEIKTRKSID